MKIAKLALLLGLILSIQIAFAAENGEMDKQAVAQSPYTLV